MFGLKTVRALPGVALLEADELGLLLLSIVIIDMGVWARGYKHSANLMTVLSPVKIGEDCTHW